MIRTANGQIRKYAALIIFVTGLVMAGVNLFGYFRAKKEYEDLIARCSETIDGEVVSCDSYTVKKRKRISKHNYNTYTETRYKTTVSYTVDGKGYSMVYDSTSSFPVGAMTQLKYDPNDPSTSFLGSTPPSNYNSRIAMIITSGFISLVGIAAFLKLRNQY